MKLQNKSSISWNVKKHKKTSVNFLQRHNQRRPGQKHSNKNIDPTKTKDNIRLISPDGTYYKTIEEELKERYRGKRTIRVNQIHLVTQTVQFGGIINDAPEEERVEILKDVSGFLTERYGRENVLSSTIHVDETNPHLHFDVIPLTSDGRLSAKEVFGPRALKSTQDDLLEYLQDSYPQFKFGRLTKEERAFSNGKTQEEFEVLRDSLRQSQEEAQRAVRLRNLALEQQRQLEERVSELEREKYERKKEIADLKAGKKRLTTQLIKEREARLQAREEKFAKREERFVKREELVASRESRVEQREKSIDDEVDSRVQLAREDIARKYQKEFEEKVRKQKELRRRENRLFDTADTIQKRGGKRPPKTPFDYDF